MIFIINDKSRQFGYWFICFKQM